MESDIIDRRLIHALQIDGRAPFSRIAEVLGVSDQTVARRYRRLTSRGRLRVVGQTVPRLVGEVRWYVRVRCRPDFALAVAEALARRSDTSFIMVTSGGTEINFVVQSRSDRDRDALLLQKLPRTPRVDSVSAHCLLHVYYGGADEHPRFLTALTEQEAAALRRPAPAGTPVELSPQDYLLLDELTRDGRATLAQLAAATGWSETSAGRRLDALLTGGALYLDLDVDSYLLGRGTQARLWMSVPPAEQDAVGDALAAHEEVAFVSATTGPSNLVAAVACRDVFGLHEYITGPLGRLRAIQQLETAPVIRSVKGAAMIMP
ncbi:Lrp/AsnC family transcriptional regulator [Nonomuraea endophytica]|uniref:DNA-binding Lrp family transcriptional regulator n=1 Tax=Nonomuraea endophytica TaxID=714136 RepID=A0A7W8A3N4_9ACTN|nr:Lrp/AsnC family transcriptional regulator [Nonomuraea endophytica]MBB5078215.1 DNA-binding Lrp family transcriptional regulator [Nonomuraea endophytica]